MCWPQLQYVRNQFCACRACLQCDESIPCNAFTGHLRRYTVAAEKQSESIAGGKPMPAPTALETLVKELGDLRHEFITGRRNVPAALRHTKASLRNDSWRDESSRSALYTRDSTADREAGRTEAVRATHPTATTRNLDAPRTYHPEREPHRGTFTDGKRIASHDDSDRARTEHDWKTRDERGRDKGLWPDRQQRDEGAARNDAGRRGSAPSSPRSGKDWADADLRRDLPREDARGASGQVDVAQNRGTASALPFPRTERPAFQNDPRRAQRPSVLPPEVAGLPLASTASSTAEALVPLAVVAASNPDNKLLAVPPVQLQPRIYAPATSTLGTAASCVVLTAVDAPAVTTVVPADLSSAPVRELHAATAATPDVSPGPLPAPTLTAASIAVSTNSSSEALQIEIARIEVELAVAQTAEALVRSRVASVKNAADLKVGGRLQKDLAAAVQLVMTLKWKLDDLRDEAAGASEAVVEEASAGNPALDSGQALPHGGPVAASVRVPTAKDPHGAQDTPEAAAVAPSELRPAMLPQKKTPLPPAEQAVQPVPGTQQEVETSLAALQSTVAGVQQIPCHAVPARQTVVLVGGQSLVDYDYTFAEPVPVWPPIQVEGMPPQQGEASTDADLGSDASVANLRTGLGDLKQPNNVERISSTPSALQESPGKRKREEQPAVSSQRASSRWAEVPAEITPDVAVASARVPTQLAGDVPMKPTSGIVEDAGRTAVSTTVVAMPVRQPAALPTSPFQGFVPPVLRAPQQQASPPIMLQSPPQPQAAQQVAPPTASAPWFPRGLVERLTVAFVRSSGRDGVVASQVARHLREQGAANAPTDVLSLLRQLVVDGAPIVHSRQEYAFDGGLFRASRFDVSSRRS
jgi:hypothetical protein